MIKKLVVAFVGAMGAVSAFADVVVPMHMVNEQGVGASVGQITISESSYGLVLTPDLHDVPSGVHGFHLHQNPSCEPKETDGKMVVAGGAGGHYDPLSTNKHGTPWGDGHLGDLPALFVDANGQSKQPVLAPRLKLSDVHGRALVIHAGGDNHSDHPAALGGGGGRVSCGVIL